MNRPNKTPNLLKRTADIITTVIAVIIAQILADKFLGGSPVWTLIIMVAILLIFMPLGTLIDRKIDEHLADKAGQ